ncbi:MAG TPA: 16S rRNA (guanine(527)-N(7))-methyltransferase RsmG [Micropepsaceae bacterium]|jgi:16S rRNA (guanine527-N7)-methyltransferase|nr:16S rRNA (guanine(527)-N(7))-methyltransferase RsmG [Micropepsaceae bacterium]
MPPDSLAIFGPEQFAQSASVSRETMARLETYAAMLRDWNARQNLVSDASLADLWRRHFWDSAQLLPLIPKTATSLVDLGSGAGFPGLVLAELLRDRAGFRTVLYEATAKKCRFLEAVAAALYLPIEIRPARIEDAVPQRFDVITARACAPLEKLLSYAQRFWGKSSVALFLKGQNVEVELTEAHKSWKMDVERHVSRSDVTGVVLEIRELHRVSAERKHSPR